MSNKCEGRRGEARREGKGKGKESERARERKKKEKEKEQRHRRKDSSVVGQTQHTQHNTTNKSRNNTT